MRNNPNRNNTDRGGRPLGHVLGDSYCFFNTLDPTAWPIHRYEAGEEPHYIWLPDAHQQCTIHDHSGWEIKCHNSVSALTTTNSGIMRRFNPGQPQPLRAMNQWHHDKLDDALPQVRCRRSSTSLCTPRILILCGRNFIFIFLYFFFPTRSSKVVGSILSETL